MDFVPDPRRNGNRRRWIFPPFQVNLNLFIFIRGSLRNFRLNLWAWLFIISILSLTLFSVISPAPSPFLSLLPLVTLYSYFASWNPVFSDERFAFLILLLGLQIFLHRRCTRRRREVATFAGGSFWGVEDNFLKRYPPAEKKGILETSVGFIGGEDNGTTPTFSTIASTGHAQALRIVFDPEVVSYGELVEFFYRTHDPTNVNRQGDDVGPQFRSAIFTHSPDQFEVAKRVTDEVQEKHFTPHGRQIVTEITPASGQWWRADDSNQQYLSKYPYSWKCETHKSRQW